MSTPRAPREIVRQPALSCGILSRIIAKVDEEDFVILNIHVRNVPEVYNFKGED